MVQRRWQHPGGKLRELGPSSLNEASIGRLRQMVRQMLKGELAEIDTLVQKILA
jgi:hypothetical protein